MTEFFGLNFPTPDVTGLLSASWIYIAIVVLIGGIIAIVLSVWLFFLIHNKRIEIWENIGGGTVLVRTRSHIARLQTIKNGVQVLQVPFGEYFSSFGKKIAPNTYAFIRDSDGYYYNSTARDLKLNDGLFDFEKTDENVKMMATANDIIIQNNYNPNKNMQIFMGIFMVIMFIGAMIFAWLVLGKIGGIGEELSTTQAGFQAIAEQQTETTNLLINAGLSNQNVPVINGLQPA